MQCDKCDDSIKDNAIYELKDKRLCADCYIDLLIGVPDVDFSKLPPEVQCHLQAIRKNWNRDRPNRHRITFNHSH